LLSVYSIFQYYINYNYRIAYFAKFRELAKIVSVFFNCIYSVYNFFNFTGLGFVANNADDWFKAGEEYSRLLSQLTEKFDQYQELSESNGDAASKKSLVQNSLNSRSRVQYVLKNKNVYQRIRFDSFY